MKKINEIAHTPLWLFILLTFVLVLRIPSFFEPYSYGDEMIYLTLGEGIRQGVTLYKNLHDNKPPLLYLTAAIAGSLFWFKVILTLSLLITIFLFWKLVERLMPNNKRAVQLSTIVFAILTTIPLLEGNIANAELFMICPIIIAFLLLTKMAVKNIHILSAGILFSIAALYKIPAIFDMPAAIFLWIIAIKKIDFLSIKKVAIKSVILVLGFLIPITISMVYYFFQGAFQEYLSAAFMQNVGYLSSWRPDSVREPFLVRNGPLLIRAAIVLGGLLTLFKFRSKVSKTFVFTSGWLIFTLFAVTLSERPYPHYLIQSIPAVSILIGMLVYERKIEQVLVIIPLTLFFFIPVYYKFWYYQTANYYVRFVKFASNQISKDEYLKSFGDRTPRNYKVAAFIKSSTSETDKIFVWGDDSVIYALSKRLPPIKFVANYHIKDFSSQEDVYRQLDENKPELVILLPGSESFPLLHWLLIKNYVLSENIDGAEVWKLLRINKK